MPQPNPADACRRLAILACDVFEAEVRFFLKSQETPEIVDLQFLEMGLHDRPDQLRLQLQQAVHEVEDRACPDAVALVYGLCGTGLTGVTARHCRLVLPRAHDCITVLLGSRQRYDKFTAEHPDVYWYSPGWNRGGRVPSAEKFERLRLAYAEKFDEEDADFLVETERSSLTHVHKACHVEFPGMHDASSEGWGPDYTRRCAAGLGWDFMHLKGDPQLLQDLLAARWDAERFLVIEPGQAVAQTTDSRIIEARPASSHP